MKNQELAYVFRYLTDKEKFKITAIVKEESGFRVTLVYVYNGEYLTAETFVPEMDLIDF